MTAFRPVGEQYHTHIFFMIFSSFTMLSTRERLRGHFLLVMLSIVAHVNTYARVPSRQFDFFHNMKQHRPMNSMRFGRVLADKLGFNEWLYALNRLRRWTLNMHQDLWLFLKLCVPSTCSESSRWPNLAFLRTRLEKILFLMRFENAKEGLWLSVQFKGDWE